MNKKITIKKQDALALLLLAILIKISIYYYPVAEPRVFETAYDIITTPLQTVTVGYMEISQSERNTDIHYYYVGRGNCPDCRDAVNNIMVLSEIVDKELGGTLYYVKLKNKISEEDRRYLDSVEIDNIPTIAIICSGQCYLFEYDQLTSNNYVEAFSAFINNIKGEREI